MKYEKTVVADYMNNSCAGEVKRLLEDAGRLMEQSFLFEQPWDMEPCGVPYTLEPMVWDRTPNGDPEWVYMLNRHGYLHRLLQAYLVTGDVRYSRQVVWYILAWIDSNPIRSEGGETIRTIDTGIRCMNWISLLLRMQEWRLVEETESMAILASLGSQFSYMKESYIEKYTLSNWGLLQTTAICCGYLWFEEYLPGDGLKDWAWGELRIQIGLQVLEDGSHWEQSILYHVEVLNSCMKLLTGCRYAGYPAPDWLKTAVGQMSRYVLFAAGPDLRQLAQADSDVTDVRDVLTKAAVLCGDGALKYGGFPAMDLDSVWMLGAWGLWSYHSLESREPKERRMVCMDTGNIYLRSAWTEDANYTYLHCGPLGSAHGHGDLTHMCLYYRGEPFLIDSGRYSYRENEPLRTELKEAGAHNVRLVDHASPAKTDGSWSYEAYGEAMKNYCSSKGAVHYIEMAYHYELTKGQLCLVKRKVLFHEAGIWLIVDDICCGGEHLASEAWHLDSGVRVKECVRDQNGLNRILLKGNTAALNLWSKEAYNITGCTISKRYNELEKSQKLVRVAQLTDRLTDWRCFAGEGITINQVLVRRAGKTVPEEEAGVTALELELTGGESFVFLMWNRETFRGNKLYFCKGAPVYGRAVVLRLEQGRLLETLRM